MQKIDIGLTIWDWEEIDNAHIMPYVTFGLLLVDFICKKNF